MQRSRAHGVQRTRSRRAESAEKQGRCGQRSKVGVCLAPLAAASFELMFFSSMGSSTWPALQSLTLSSVFLYFWNFFLNGFLPARSHARSQRDRTRDQMRRLHAHGRLHANADCTLRREGAAVVEGKGRPLQHDARLHGDRHVYLYREAASRCFLPVSSSTRVTPSDHQSPE